MNTISQEKNKMTIVLIAVAKLESVFFIPILASIAVIPAKNAEPKAYKLQFRSVFIMDIQLKIMEIANNLNITKKDKKDIDEYLDHNELGLAFEVLCVSIERDNIKISQKDYEIINTLGVQMEMDSNLWSSLKNNIIK